MPPATGPPDLILHNANVLTMDPRLPRAEVVAVRGERIAWVGTADDVVSTRSPGVRMIDCEGQTLVPGFIDAHVHVLAFAARLLAVNCGARAVSSIRDIQSALRERAAASLPGGWIRAGGYDDFALDERRHPTRWDLDAAVPNHPVRLDHRSGHAIVLNSAALAAVGVSADTPDPSGGMIDRDPDTGEPTGLLLDGSSFLDGRIPRLSERELEEGVRRANRLMVSRGVTSVQDATPSNSPERWDLLARLKRTGSLTPRLTVMAGVEHVGRFLERGLGPGSGGHDMDVGPAKLMLSVDAGCLEPPVDELADAVRSVHEAGFQAAVHAVEASAVEAAAGVLKGGHRDRIEHCSECPPSVLRRLRGSGVVVVTQPRFIYDSGARYLSQVPDHMRPWLYRVRSLQEAGVVAASSDAPVSEPHPLLGMYAAITRRSEGGEVVGADEAVSAESALAMHTVDAAYAARHESDRGTIEAGKLADFALIDRDPTAVEPHELLSARVSLTVVGGRVVWPG